MTILAHKRDDSYFGENRHQLIPSGDSCSECQCRDLIYVWQVVYLYLAIVLNGMCFGLEIRIGIV